MNAIRTRIAAVVASALVAGLGAWGVAEVTPELAGKLERWLDHTFELLLLIGYAVVHPWLQKRLNPTGAFTRQAARELERVAHVRDRA